MGEETAKPSGRKRGRPRTVANEQEVPEVGRIPNTPSGFAYNHEFLETSQTTPPRAAGISQKKGDHDR